MVIAWVCATVALSHWTAAKQQHRAQERLKKHLIKIIDDRTDRIDEQMMNAMNGMEERLLSAIKAHSFAAVVEPRSGHRGTRGATPLRPVERAD